jgi:hypothetical protein
MQSGLLVAKGAASHTTTALLDIAFLDHFARLGERAKDRDKVTKITNKLFPNKITIAIPTDPNEVIYRLFMVTFSSWLNGQVKLIKMWNR